MQTLSDRAEEYLAYLLNKIENKEYLDIDELTHLERSLRIELFENDILNELIGLTKGEVKLYNKLGKQNLTDESEKEIKEILDVIHSTDLHFSKKRIIERSLRLYYYNEEILKTQCKLTKTPTTIIYDKRK
jgi:hypothetical protein